VTIAIGIDVGATKIAAGRVDVERGELLGAERRPTHARRGPRAVLDDCLALARLLAGDEPPAGVGIGVCELVDGAGRVQSAETIDWRELDVAAELAAIAPAVVESDVRAAALAEARFGAGRDEPDFLYVSIGTGISHCLVTDGRPRAGAHGSAIGTGAPLVERWSSGLALARRTGLPDAAAVLADPQSEATVDDAARRLGAVLAALVNALDPGAVIFGGGLGLRAPYRDRVVAAMRAGIYDPRARQLPAVRAALGAEAGVIGAALAALPRREPHPRGPAGPAHR
jgi:glucokinase